MTVKIHPETPLYTAKNYIKFSRKEEYVNISQIVHFSIVRIKRGHQLVHGFLCRTAKTLI